MSQIIKHVYLLVFSLHLTSCTFTSSKLSYERAENYAKNSEFKKAVESYKNVIKISPNSKDALYSARAAARILHFELNQFHDAIDLYQYLILHTSEKKEVQSLQEIIASIYLKKLGDHHNSIIEYSKLLQIEKSKNKKNEIQFLIIKSYYNLNQFYQAQIEIERLLKDTDLTREFEFRLKNFKANIYLTTKDYEKALEIFKTINEQFPKLSKKENIGISISLCYEELSQIDEAISALEEIKNVYSSPDFIELKIKRLISRKKNLPGARGKVR